MRNSWKPTIEHLAQDGSGNRVVEHLENGECLRNARRAQHQRRALGRFSVQLVAGEGPVRTATVSLVGLLHEVPAALEVLRSTRAAFGVALYALLQNGTDHRVAAARSFLLMITIDGSQHSGSGTIVRYSVALSALLHQPIRIINVRQNRAQPGLRRQHVASVLACAALCGASTEGVHVESREFAFSPGKRIAGGTFDWNIGTAGSTTMLALSVLPVACFADAPVSARIEGGVFQDFAPSPHHMQHVLASMLRRMGADIDLRVERAGYVPGGAGVVQLTVVPSSRGLTGITLGDAGRLDTVHGIALASLLAGRRVSDRMAAACEAKLEEAGLACDIERVFDDDTRHAGANLSIWAESTTGCRFGADRAGKLGRTSEAIGEFVAQTFLLDVRSGATVDRHLADQLVLFAALAHGRSTYVVPEVTAHVLSNLWLVHEFGATVSVRDNEVAVDGIALCQPPGS